MGMNLRGMDLNHDVVQLVASEAVRAGMETPLREPILRAVEQSTEEAVIQEIVGQEAADGEKSRSVMAVQGLIVFLVMFVVLYVSFKRLTSGESS